MAPPADIPVHLVQWIESSCFHKAFGKAKRHGGIIRPLPGLESKGSAADNVGDGFKGTRGFELHRGSQGIPNREANEATLPSGLGRDLGSHWEPCKV